jgi:hypothetical protein
MEDTLEYFDWKCPYTGKDLRQSIEKKDGSYATDHIYPQNKEWCGLNVKGNLIIVDKEANTQKHNKDIETFLMNDTVVLGRLDMKIRQERLQKIKEFQKICGYNPEQIRNKVSPILKARYDEIRAEQEKCINELLSMLNQINICPTTNISIHPKTEQTKTNKEISNINSGNDFLETIKEEISMGYKLCPICQLNMIEDDKEQCNVCGGKAQASYSLPKASATIDLHYLLKSFYAYCKTPGIDSGKAQSYVNAIQYLCDFLGVHQINEQIVAKFKSLEIEISRSNNATRIKLLNFLERRRQISYLTGGFIRAALRYFYPFWEEYKNKNI